jgi:hypothetical protein
MIDVWTLYCRPSNHDKAWVVRRWHGDKPTTDMFESDSREEVEAFVLSKYPDAYWLPRQPGDDMTIVGTWI